MLPQNKNSIMLSPSGEQVAIFIDGKWKLFISGDALTKLHADVWPPQDELEFYKQISEEYAGTDKCPVCKGEGWTAGHDEDCDGENCDSICPVQVPCKVCYGTGKYRERDAITNTNGDDDLPF